MLTKSLKILLHRFGHFFQSTAWPQGLSSHSIVSSSTTIRPCSPWGSQGIGHLRTWLAACFSAPHSQATEVMLKKWCWQTQ